MLKFALSPLGTKAVFCHMCNKALCLRLLPLFMRTLEGSEL